jgi:hypothetical protein
MREERRDIMHILLAVQSSQTKNTTVPFCSNNWCLGYGQYQRHYIRDCAQVRFNRLRSSFCLVWRPSLEEFPGSSRLLISLSPDRWLLLVLRTTKPVYNFLLSSLRNYCFVKHSHPHSLAKSSFILSLGQYPKAPSLLKRYTCHGMYNQCKK